MSKRDLIAEASDAIAVRLYPGHATYCVGTVSDLIVCVPSSQKPPGFTLIREYHAEMLAKGLSHAHWLDLGSALINHFKTEASCPNNQTH